MTDEIRNNIINELAGDFTPAQLKEIDLAVVKALQGYSIAKEETLPAIRDMYPAEVKEFIARKRVKGCSEKTIRHYEYTLRNFLRWAKKDLKKMTDLDILIYLDYIQTQSDMSGISLENNVRRVLSTFYAFLHDTGKIEKNPMKSVDSIKYRVKVRKPLSDIEMEKIRAACRTDRERALVEVLYSTGARASEIAGLDRADIDYQNRRALITGKGDKQRYVFFNAKAVFAIQNYLSGRTDDNPALFVRTRNPYPRLTTSGIEYIIAHIGERAGLDRKLYPHLFRHTFATDMLSNGAPIEEVSKLLGHEKIETTEIYAKCTTDMLASQHKRCIA